jgi:Domain of unknown function (DUF6745)
VISREKTIRPLRGHVRLRETEPLSVLQPGLRLASLDLEGRTDLQGLPEDLAVSHLNLSRCTGLRSLPSGLRCDDLVARESGLHFLPADLQVRYKLDLTGCQELEHLPDGLKVSTLLLSECIRLAELPGVMEANLLDARGCTALVGWRESGQVRIGRLNASDCVRLSALPSCPGSMMDLDLARCTSLVSLPEALKVSRRLNLNGCVRLTRLPEALGSVANLDLGGCAGLSELPVGVSITGTLEVAGSGLTARPPDCTGTLRWRGVVVDDRIAFHPETITAREVLAEGNTERRRIMLERMGNERFFAEADAEVLDTDRDPGGERRLLRVALPREEPLVCLSVSCPSTGRGYLLRVPPTITTCRQAAAWTAGLEPGDYRPLLET